MSILQNLSNQPQVVADGSVTQERSTWDVRTPHVLFCLIIGSLFTFANYVSLRPTDLWCHVAFGEWIAHHSALPTEDPFLRLAEGMEILDLAWLSQWALYTIYKLGGSEAISTLFAILTAATFAVLGRVSFLRSNRIDVATLGILLVVGVGWSRLWTVRPETFGAFCFALLLWLISARPTVRFGALAGPTLGWALRRSSSIKAALCLLFAVWVNLHGSFVCGLAVLVCCCAGRAVDVVVRTRSARALWTNRPLRQWLLVLELATFSCLLNPYGMKLLVDTVLFGGHENLRDVLEWQSLSLTGIGGIEFALSWVLLMVVFRCSRRRIGYTEVLLLGTFSVAAATGLRMITWYAPIAIFVAVPHIAEIVTRRWPMRVRVPTPAAETDNPNELSKAARRSLLFGTACGLVIWACFSMSPSSVPLLGGKARDEQQLYRPAPLGVTEYLKQTPPRGQIWNPQHWGDWLIVHVPGDYSVFSTSMIHHVPPQVWRDYQKVFHAMPTWENVLERYRVTTVLVDKLSQPQLAPTIRRSSRWRVQFEDDQSLLLTRVETGATATNREATARSRLEQVNSPSPIASKENPRE